MAGYNPPNEGSYIHKVMSSTVLDNKITPTWFKISDSSYNIHSKQVAGYGRAIRNISVSHDCPSSFLRTEHLVRPKDFTPAPKEIASRKAGLEASYVLPGGGSRFTEQPLKGRGYCKIISKNQLIIEPKVTDRPCPRINLSWDSSRRHGSTSTTSSTSPFFSSAPSAGQLPLSPVKISGRKTSHCGSSYQDGNTQSNSKINNGYGSVNNTNTTTNTSTSNISIGGSFTTRVEAARARTADPGPGMRRIRPSEGCSNLPPRANSINYKKSWWIQED